MITTNILTNQELKNPTKMHWFPQEMIHGGIHVRENEITLGEFCFKVTSKWKKYTISWLSLSRTWSATSPSCGYRQVWGWYSKSPRKCGDQKGWFKIGEVQYMWKFHIGSIYVVVFKTILKNNVSQWEGLSHILWKIKMFETTNQHRLQDFTDQPMWNYKNSAKTVMGSSVDGNNFHDNHLSWVHPKFLLYAAAKKKQFVHWP